MRQFKAAIIGLGNIGFKFSRLGLPFLATHFEAYRHNPQTSLIAVADIDTSILRQARHVFAGRVYHDYQEMLRKEQPEVVSICTPDETHCQILQAVVKLPSVRGIWCEKPLAIDRGEAKAMVALCERRKITLAVNFIRRYDSLYKYLKEQLARLVGNIQTITFYYSGGIVTTGSHLIDILCFWLGNCQVVSAQQLPVGLLGRLRFGNIWVSLIPLDTKAYSSFEMQIWGVKARLDIINKPFGEFAVRYLAPAISPYTKRPFLADHEKQPWRERFPRQYMEAALADLVKCIETGKMPISSGQTALKSLELMHALLWSAEHKGENCRLPFRGRIKHLPAPQGDLKG